MNLELLSPCQTLRLWLLGYNGIRSGLGIDNERSHLLYLTVPQSVLWLTNLSPNEVIKKKGGWQQETEGTYKNGLISISFIKFTVTSRILNHIEHCYYFGATNIKLRRSILEGFWYENFLQVHGRWLVRKISILVCHQSIPPLYLTFQSVCACTIVLPLLTGRPTYAEIKPMFQFPGSPHVIVMRLN